ncbi:MAG: BatA domain-containing protein [Planctomycetales bacterium]|nr:BatA domain-containing protein [Planctomycetales bacterium]
MFVAILLADLTFTSPVLWAGAWLVSLPIAAHLLNRRSQRRHYFPSLELIRSLVAEQSRFMKWRRLLLLLLRCLCVLAIVAAFTRPIWHVDPAAASAAATQNAVVILLDASASMRQNGDDGVLLFERSKAAADRLLTELRIGSDVSNLIYLTSTPVAALSELSGNIPMLRSELAASQPSFERADILAGLRLAGEMLREQSGNGRVIVISDWQISTWQEVDALSLINLLPFGTQVTLLDANGAAPENISVRRVRMEPAHPLLEQQASVVAELVNDSDRRKDVRVTFRADEQESNVATFLLEANERREIAFAYRPTSLTPTGLTVAVDRDLFAVDNAAYGVCTPVPGIPVAIVADDDLSQTGTSGYFLNLALNPFGDRHDRFRVMPLHTRELPTAALAEQAAVLVGYQTLLDPETAQVLEEYVRRGGTLIYYCGQGPVRRNLQTLDEVVTGGWLPWITGPRQDLDRWRDIVAIDSGRWSSRLLNDFDVTSQIALREVPFSTFWRVEQVRGDADVLLSFSNGVAALARRTHELGQVVLANFSPAQDTSDLGKHGVFVALTQILAQQVADVGAARRQLLVGDSLAATLPGPVDAQNVRLWLGDQPLTAAISQDDDHAEFVYERALGPGVYRVRNGDKCLAAFAVNVDPSECELKREDLDDLRTRLNLDAPTTPRQSVGTWSSPLDLRGTPLEAWLLAAALCLAGVEMGLLGWWRK